MRIAIISDIHSNIHALNAVVEEIKSLDVDTILSTGDSVGYLTKPNEVIKALKKNGVLSIMGNHDQVIAQGEKVPEEKMVTMSEMQLQSSASRVFTNNTITSTYRDYLAGLPKELVLTFDRYKVKLVHGSPNSIDEYMYDDDDLLMKFVEDTEEDVIISGHTHIPYHKQMEGKHFINAGSVGKPKHGDSRAAYVILNIDDHQIDVEFRKVAYNVQAIVDEIKAEPLISDKLIENLEEGL